MGEMLQELTAEEREAQKRQRKIVRILMHFLPMFVGLVGLFLVSSWSIDIRVKNPNIDTASYYLGMGLILLAFQAPLWLEIYRRRTKRFMQWRVLMAMGILVSLLAFAAAQIAPDVEYEWLDD